MTASGGQVQPCPTVSDHEWGDPVVRRQERDAFGRTVVTSQQTCSVCGRVRQLREVTSVQSAYGRTWSNTDEHFGENRA